VTKIAAITSRDNPLLAQLRRLNRHPDAYRKLGIVWLEGEQLCRAALQFGTALRPGQQIEGCQVARPIALQCRHETGDRRPAVGAPIRDFAAQAEQVFRNLNIALQAVGCTANDLVKLTVFVRDMGNLAAYREARNRFFATVTPPAAPAVTLVEVSKLYGPDFLIEIEAVAASAT